MEVSSRLIVRDGRPAGIQGIARDIRERKGAEQAVRGPRTACSARLRIADVAGNPLDCGGPAVAHDQPAARPPSGSAPRPG